MMRPGPGGITPNNPESAVEPTIPAVAAAPEVLPVAAEPVVPPEPREPLRVRLERFVANNRVESIVLLILAVWAVVFLAEWLVL